MMSQLTVNIIIDAIWCNYAQPQNLSDFSMSTMDKRAHHNALERKRRDHIKDSFTGLRDAIPTMKGGDKSSRAQILKKASEYIQVCFLWW